MLRIYDAYLSHEDSFYQPEWIFHPGETIRYNVIHSISPHEDVRYRIYGLAQRVHLNGVVEDSLRFETVWRPGRAFVVDGNYSRASLLTTLSAGTIPADPDQAFLDSIAPVRERRRVMSDLTGGRHFLEFTPGYWTFTAFLGLIDPGWPDDITEFVVSWPYTYIITKPPGT